MTGRVDVERVLDAFLAPEADQLPDRVIEASLSEIARTPQRRALRVPWRFPPMNTFARLATVAAAIVIGLAGAVYLFTPRSNVGPAATPTPAAPTNTPTPSIDTTGWVAFTSSRHGFTISYPAAWTVAPATEPWPTGVGAEAPGPPSPELDELKDPAGSVTSFVVVSQPLAGGRTPDAWLTNYEQSAPLMPQACWPAPAAMERITIGGQPGWIHGGIATCGFTEVVTFAGGRIYEFTAYFTPGRTPVDRGLFDALIGSVTLNPSAADDTPVASSSPGPS